MSWKVNSEKYNLNFFNYCFHTDQLSKVHPYEPRRPSEKRNYETGFNSLYTDGLFNCYMLTESICHLRGVEYILSLDPFYGFSCNFWLSSFHLLLKYQDSIMLSVLHAEKMAMSTLNTRSLPTEYPLRIGQFINSAFQIQNIDSLFWGKQLFFSLSIMSS